MKFKLILKEENSMVTCPHCHKQTNGSKKFCTNCGEEISQSPQKQDNLAQQETGENITCPHCHKQTNANNNFCTSCGEPLRKDSKERASNMASQNAQNQADFMKAAMSIGSYQQQQAQQPAQQVNTKQISQQAQQFYDNPDEVERQMIEKIISGWSARGNIVDSNGRDATEKVKQMMLKSVDDETAPIVSQMHNTIYVSSGKEMIPMFKLVPK